MPLAEVASHYRLFYLDENQFSKRAILLLHGLGANSASWQLQIPDLTAAGYRSIAPDAPGFGQSPYPGGGLTVKMIANTTRSLLDMLDIQICHIVGISMGGTIALQMAIDFPQVVDKLVLVNTFARLNLSNPLIWPYFLVRAILVYTLGLPRQAKAVAQHIFPRPEQEMLRQALIQQILQADPHGYRAAMWGLARFDVRRQLANVSAPTLVVTGDQDTTVPPPNQQELVEGIPNACQAIIHGAGHAVTVEKSETFNQILLQFLNG
jgi:3-oxoadipate enol-lactonase